MADIVLRVPGHSRARCFRADRRFASWLATFALLLAAGHLLMVREAAGEPFEHSRAEQQARQEAIAAVPLDRLNQDARDKLSGIMSHPAIYRRLPVTVIPSDPDLYLFLVRYPEVIVNMWQLMGVTNVRVQRTGEFTFHAADGAGTVSDVELVYGDRNVHVFYAEGSYEGPLLRRLIRGRCVLVLRSDYARTEGQEIFVTNRLDVFAQLDNVGAEIIARTLHPLVESAVDHNFAESTRFLGQVSAAAEKRGSSMQQLAARLTNIDAEVRDAFATLAAHAHHRATLREAGPVTWKPDSPSTPVSVAPVVTPPAVVEGASSGFDSGRPDKPLRLRR